MANNCGAVSRLLLLFFIAALLPMPSLEAALDSVESDFYTAGVVEFRYSLLSLRPWADNLAGYLDIIESSNASATDIIIFPEATLNSFETATFVPDPEQQLVPCLVDPQFNYYHELLVTLSCAARIAGKYIVINLSEKQLCSEVKDDPRPCSDDDLNVYNSNVVFDRSGAVVSRYRKVHLYGEPRNTTYLPELSFFETDFGVTFGHFICFDILYYTPAHEMLVELGVRDFVFPSMWFSQLPLLTGVQFQQSWAFANDVNLLAAGASRPEVGNSGSGIYHGRQGTLTSVMRVGTGERRLYVSQVPKYKSTTIRRNRRALAANSTPRLSRSDYLMKRDYLQNYKSVELDLTNSTLSHSQDLCDGSFCCHFDLAWQPISDLGEGSIYYSYRLGAYDGLRNELSVEPNYLRNCAIFACTGPTIEECGTVFDSKILQQPQVSFTRLEIESKFPQSREFLLMPNSLREDLMPLEPSQFEWTQSEDGYYQKVRYSLRESVEVANLLAFAVYGNYYDDVCTYGNVEGDAAADCGYEPKDDGASALTLWTGGWLLMIGATAFATHWS